MRRHPLRSVLLWSRRRKWLAAVCVVALLGALVAVAPTVRHELGLARECFRIRAQIRDRGAVVDVAGRSPKVFILGDSYASGDQLADYRQAWSFDFARDTGLRTDVAAIGLTGFLSGGFCKSDQYGTRVDEILAARPEVLVVQSGVSDSEFTSAEIEESAVAFLRRVRSVRLVIVIGVLDVPNRQDELRVDSAVRRAAARADRPFIPTTDWGIQLGPDEVHPTAAGAAVYAGKVADVVDRRLGR